MSAFRRRLVGTLLLLLGTTASVAAQTEGSRRQGFWLNVGLGFGTADFNCDNCGSTDRESGLSGQLALGGTLNSRLLLGAESDGWTKDESGVRSTFSNLTGVVYFYPSATTDLFLKGGVGISYYKFSGDGASVDDTGLGFVVGAGYDIPIGRKTSITPMVSFNFGSLGNNQGAESVKINWVNVGATFTLH